LVHKDGEYHTCKGCGNEFWVFKSRLPKGYEFCSRTCKLTHSTKKVTCICKHCGKEYQEWKYRVEKHGAGKFCSRECAKPYLGMYAKSIKGKKGIIPKERCNKISDAKKEYYKNPENLERMKNKLRGQRRRPEKILGGEYSIYYGGKCRGSICKDLERLLKEAKEQERQQQRLEGIRLKYLSKKKKPKFTKEEIARRAREAKLGERNPNYGKKLSEATIKKRTFTYIERLVGGFWYGNVKYYERVEKEYCELWTPELCDRIRAAWGYRSAISGKTSEENRGKALSCHHVYYQTKASCEFDEDTGGYYAWINVGTQKNPEMYKHYINGSPNKFVPLTRPEHSKTNSNRLFWILYFEEIIARHGGKCYLTKEEAEWKRSRLATA